MQLHSSLYYLFHIFQADLPSEEEKEKWESEVNMKFFAVEGKMSVMAQAISAEAEIDKKEREEDYEPGI